MSAATLQLPTDMTVAEFLAWCPDNGRRWQLVDGAPQAMAPPSPGHGAMQSRLSWLLTDHLIRQERACDVVTTPGIVPHVGTRSNFRIPDLAVTCTPIASNDVHLRDPLLLIEVLSPSNERDTRANVWTYVTIPSVQEILLLHPDVPRAELLRRRPDGTWPSDPQIVTEGDIVLESLGFRAPLAVLYRTAGSAG